MLSLKTRTQSKLLLKQQTPKSYRIKTLLQNLHRNLRFYLNKSMLLKRQSQSAIVKNFLNIPKDRLLRQPMSQSRSSLQKVQKVRFQLNLEKEVAWLTQVLKHLNNTQIQKSHLIVHCSRFKLNLVPKKSTPGKRQCNHRAKPNRKPPKKQNLLRSENKPLNLSKKCSLNPLTTPMIQKTWTRVNVN